ncbi:hypothetical protein BESB_029160 [Besnoitia besnoiti]|uniref:Uncharacterized protein n=1 Tax=Besnoitia besnoiti TaxID=94643 RepID=A0A2A9M599_BESBE|nr:uncharacterized protein BESB_029160 [Besnoitia besnoiti]PFH31481.1 hypothetical protein BESB_029160 [Besnoitia besnoiti]
MGLRRGKKTDSGEEASPHFSLRNPLFPKHEERSPKTEKDAEDAEGVTVEENKEANYDRSKHERYIRHGKKGDGHANRAILTTLKKNPFSKKKGNSEFCVEDSPATLPHETQQASTSDETNTGRRDAPVSVTHKAPVFSKGERDSTQLLYPPSQPVSQSNMCQLSDSLLFGISTDKNCGSFERGDSGTEQRGQTSPWGATLGYHRSFRERLADSEIIGTRKQEDGPFQPRFPVGAAEKTLAVPASASIQEPDPPMMIHRYDKEAGKILQPVTVADVCAEAAQSERQQQIMESLRGKTWREKLQWGLDTKNLGNSLYQQKKYAEATKAYQDCLLALDLGSSADVQEAAQQQLQIPVVLNLAACMLATKAYERCKALCNVALDLEPHSLKAIFRRALACFHLGELEEAKQDFRHAYSMCASSPPPEVESDVETLEQRHPTKLETKSHSLLSVKSNKDFVSGVPANADDREKFLKKVRYYLHAIAQQQQRYAKACQKMFQDEFPDGVDQTAEGNDGRAGLGRLSSNAPWMSPLAIFKGSKCSFCARRAGKKDPKSK